MEKTDLSNRSRPVHPIPDFVLQALKARGLVAAFKARPAQQQNDYIGWITRARLPEARQKRLDQMLDELQHAGTRMKNVYTPKSPKSKR